MQVGFNPDLKTHLSHLIWTITLPETNSSHLKIGRNPKGKDSLPLPPFISGVNSLLVYSGRYSFCRFHWICGRQKSSQ